MHARTHARTQACKPTAFHHDRNRRVHVRKHGVNADLGGKASAMSANIAGYSLVIIGGVAVVYFVKIMVQHTLGWAAGLQILLPASPCECWHAACAVLTTPAAFSLSAQGKSIYSCIRRKALFKCWKCEGNGCTCMPVVKTGLLGRHA
eukprot:scaffold31556_cov21-Tisochrysis_lutea.AAC.5